MADQQNQKAKSFQLSGVKKDNSLSALVLGVIAAGLLVFWFLFIWLSLALSIVAIILGLTSLKSPNRVRALIGVALGTITFVVCMMIFFAFN